MNHATGVALRTGLLLAVLVAITWLLTSVHNSAETSTRRWDFQAFYLAGAMALHGEGAQTYDVKGQATAQMEYVDPTRTVKRPDRPFISPSAVGLLFAPLALLRMSIAYSVWTFLNLLMLVVSLRLVQSLSPRARTYLPLLAATFVPTYIALMKGQMSILILFFIALAFYWLGRSRPVLAGLALGMATLKYQLVLGLLAIFMLRGVWSVVGGAAITSSMVVALSLLVSGWKAVLHYPAFVRLVNPWPDVTNLSQTISLRGILWLGMHQGPPLLMVAILSVAILLVAALAWRKLDLSAAFCIALIASLLTAYHAHTEDLTLLFIPFVLVQSRIRSISAPLISGCMLAILGFVALYRNLEVLFAVVCYLIVLFGLWNTRIQRRPSELNYGVGLTRAKTLVPRI